MVGQAKLAHTLQCAVTALAGQASLLRIASDAFAETPRKRQVFDELLSRQESLGSWAQEVQQNENHEINLPGVINMWVTLEASIEDICVSLIINNPAAVTQLKKVNTKIGDDLPTTEEDARQIYEKTLLRLKKQGLVTALLDILSLLGLRPSLRVGTEDHIKELNYVRNCALHRGGIVETRKNVEAPTLPLSVGTKLAISNEFFLRYYDAVGDLLNALHTTLERERG